MNRVPAELRDHRSLVALGAAPVEVVEPEAAELLVREGADVGVPEDDAVARAWHRREVGQLAVVPAVRALDEQVPEQAVVPQVVVVAPLHAAPVARVGDVAVAAAADVRGVVQEREREGVVRARRPRAAGVELVLGLLDGADDVDPVEGHDGVVARHAAIAAEEPRLVGGDGPPAGEGGVEPRALLVGGVAVLGDEAVVLKEVVDRAGELVGARLGDDARQQPGGADVLGRDAPGQHLLLLDDLGVKVGAERAADPVGDVDAVDVVEVVARDTRVAADVAVVQAGLGRRVAGRLRVVGQHPGHQLQVALVAAAGGDRLGQVEGDVLGDDRAGHVDHRRRGGHHDRLGHVADGQTHRQRRGLARADQHAGLPARPEAGQLHRHHVAGGGVQGAQLGQTRGVRERDARRRGVLGGGGDGGAGDRKSVLIGGRDPDVPGRRDLRPGEHRGGHDQQRKHRQRRSPRRALESWVRHGYRTSASGRRRPSTAPR